jgi:hypothetical protein
VIAAFLYLFSYYPIAIEHWTHPESITAFMLMFLFYVYLKIIEMLKGKEVETHLFKVSFLINLFFVWNFVIFIYQPRWGFGLLLCLSVLFILIRMVPAKWYRKTFFLIILPFFICLLGVYNPNETYTQHDISSKITGFKTIFFSNQNFICLEIERDIDDPGFQKYDKNILKAIRDQYHLAKDKELVRGFGIGWYPTLGYSIDYLMWGPLERILEDSFGHDEIKYNEFFRYYIIRSILRHPIMFFSKVFKELSLFYFGIVKYPLISPSLLENWHYSENALKVFETFFTKKIFLEYYNNIKYIQKLKIDMSFYPINMMNFFLKILGDLFFMILIFFHIALLTAYFMKKKNMFYFGLNGLFLYLITFAIYFTVAASLSLQPRYINDPFILLLFGEFFAISYIILLLWEVRRLFWGGVSENEKTKNLEKL